MLRLHIVTLYYLIYMQGRSWDMLGWMNHKLESRLPGEISITSDTLGFPGGSDGKEERIHL